MKKLGLLIIAAVFLAGLVAASANAQMGGGKGKGGAMGMGPKGGMGMWDGAHGQHLTSMLGLDDNQTAQVKPILYKLQKEMIKKRADIKVAEIELEEILGKDPVDMNAAEPKIKQIATLKADAAITHIQGIEALKAKLTPEQKKKLTQMAPMKGMGHDMMRCPMMEGEMHMGPHPGPTKASPAKARAGRTAPPQ
jgi:Spy/CpxP family protein refolding chaperone